MAKKRPGIVPRSSLVISLTALNLLCGIPDGSQAGCAAEYRDWDKTLKHGYEELEQGNTEKAISFFREKCIKYPLSGQCHTALGKALKRLGKITEAAEELRKATELDPSYGPGFYELGSILEGDRDWSGAIATFEKYIELNPDAGQRKAVSDRIRSCKEHL